MTVPCPRVDISIELENGNIPWDIIDWLTENVGSIYDSDAGMVNLSAEGWAAWGTRRPNGQVSEITFQFSDFRKATWFKLTWG